jgi:hypothetical protein
MYRFSNFQNFFLPGKLCGKLPIKNSENLNQKNESWVGTGDVTSANLISENSHQNLTVLNLTSMMGNLRSLTKTWR